jgi:outer membrane immunogenic protein
MAADLPVKAPAPLPAAPIPTWTGFYVGGNVGGLWANSGSGAWSPLDPANFGVFPNAGTLERNGGGNVGVVGGVHGGYNWQFAPTWVAGIEADWSWADAKASFDQPWVTTANVVRPGARASLSLNENWLATVRGRIGYLVTPATLVYFTGGVAWTKFDYAGSSRNDFPTNGTGPYLAQSQFSKTLPGYVLGGGLEYAFSGHWSVRAEYLYYHFNNTDAAVSPVFDSTGGFPPPSFPASFSWTGVTNINVGRAGVSYKF